MNRPVTPPKVSEAGYAKNRLVLFGGLTAGVAAVCCFTPLLVWGLLALGLVGLVAYVDLVLLPLLAVGLLALTVGVRRVRRVRAGGDAGRTVPPSSSPTR